LDLQPLLLLEMSLLQSLSLLLVPLFDLLHFDLVSILSLQAPVLMLLTPLELLALSFLFSKEFLPLPQVFSVQIGITGVGRSGAFKWRKIHGMDCLVRHAPGATIRWRSVRGSFSRREGRTVAKLYWSGSGRDQRHAMVGRGA
jgi:hypothetical protein